MVKNSAQVKRSADPVRQQTNSPQKKVKSELTNDNFS